MAFLFFLNDACMPSLCVCVCSFMCSCVFFNVKNTFYGMDDFSHWAFTIIIFRSAQFTNAQIVNREREPYFIFLFFFLRESFKHVTLLLGYSVESQWQSINQNDNFVGCFFFFLLRFWKIVHDPWVRCNELKLNWLRVQ